MSMVAAAADTFRSEVYKFYMSDGALAGLDSAAVADHFADVTSGLAAPLAFNTSVEPVAKPATRFWDQLSAEPAPEFEAIMAAARQFADHLHWRTNKNYIGIFDDHFFENETFTEIVGPTGLLIADNFRAGFLILGENVHYPDHSHVATELYHPVSGTGVWVQGDGQKREKPPGTPIFHTPWESHAMWATKPILALWSWAGEDLAEAKPD